MTRESNFEKTGKDVAKWLSIGHRRCVPALVACCWALTLPTATHAQSDTAQARQAYATTNQQLHQLQRIAFVSQRPGAAYKAEGNAWFDGQIVKKIEITERDDSGDVVSVFYYVGPSLVFVFEAIQGFTHTGNPGKQITVQEERFYFRDSKLFKWLSGMGPEKSDNQATSPEFSEAGTSRLAASVAFQTAAHKALSATRSLK